MAQSVEHSTAARTVPGSSLSIFLPFGKNLGACVRCGRIEKKFNSVRTIACARVIIEYKTVERLESSVNSPPSTA